MKDSNYYLFNRNIIPGLQPDGNYLNRGINIYEVFRVIDQVPLFLEDHLNRLDHSLQKCNICISPDRNNLKKDLLKLIRINKLNEGNIKLIVHAKEKTEAGFIAAFPVPYKYPGINEYSKGVKTTLLRAERESPNIKNWRDEFRKKIAYLKSEKNAYEVILINNDGFITEGSQSNIFVIKEKVIYTAPGSLVLKGITRKYIINICEKLKIKLIEEPFGISELKSADVIFITGTSPKVLPVNSVDEVQFYIKNDILLKIQKEYNQIIERYLKDHKNEI